MTEETKPKFNMKIPAINLAVLVGYTVLCRFIGQDGSYLLGNVILIHLLVCIVGAASRQSKAWILSLFLVLIIGFSSCWFAFTH